MLSSFKKPDNEPKFGNMAPPPPGQAPSNGASLRTMAVPQRPGDRTTASVIGPDLMISGNLVSKGEVQVEGEVQGDIHGMHVIVGERARVTGSILAEEVVVRGHVMGSIRGKRIMLQSTSRIEGDIFHQSLAIEQGAFFEGKSRRTQDPLAGVNPPEIVPGATPGT